MSCRLFGSGCCLGDYHLPPKSVFHLCFICGPSLLVLACLITGCGPGDKLARYKVTGNVTYQGQSVEEGTITFENPTAGEVNSSPLIAGGSYSLEVPAGDY